MRKSAAVQFAREERCPECQSRYSVLVYDKSRSRLVDEALAEDIKLNTYGDALYSFDVNSGCDHKKIQKSAR